MKKIMLTAFSAGLCLLTAAEPGLTFYNNFDSFEIDAASAAGDPRGKGLDIPDLRQRACPGPGGKGNAMRLDRKEKVAYIVNKNISSKQGTISFWFCPLNWDFNNDNAFALAAISSKKLSFRIFKHAWGPFLVAYIQYRPEPGKVISRQAQIMVDTATWTKGTWQHVAITYNNSELRLYLNGTNPPMPKRRIARRWNNKNVPPDYPVSLRGTFPDPMPEFGREARFYLGDTVNSPKVPATVRTAFDEVKIYDRPLSSSEIRAEYERVKAAAK